MQFKHLHLKNYLTLVFVMVIMTAIVGCFTPIIASDTSTKNNSLKQVLIIHSYHHGFPWTEQFESGLEDPLRKAGFILFVEYLDTYRMKTSETTKLKSDIIAQYSKMGIDYIVTTDNDAFDLMTSLHEVYFENVPWVFGGLNNLNAKDIQKPYLTGIMQNTSEDQMLQWMVDQMPQIKTLLICGDQTQTAKLIYEEIVDFNKSLKDPLTIETVFQNTIEEQITAIKGYDVSTTALYIAGSYKLYDHNEYAVTLETSTQLPVFCGVKTAIDGNVIGGWAVDPSRHGQIMAEEIIKMSQGTLISSIPIIEKPIQDIIFNYYGLKKYRIDEKYLPEGTEIINSPDTTIKLSKTTVYSVTIFIAFTIFISFLLFYFLRKERVLRMFIQESKQNISEKNMELEAYTEELLATQETLDEQFNQLQDNKEQIEKLANYDKTTGLMKVVKFIEVINANIGIHDSVFVVSLTFNNLKQVVNIFGHATYETLICNVAQKLQENLQRIEELYKPQAVGGTGKPVTYIGIDKGQDFVFATTLNQEIVEQLCIRCLELFEKPMLVNHFSFILQAQIGIASYPMHSTNIGQLVKMSLLAAIQSPYQHQKTFTMYHPDMRNKQMEIQKRQLEIQGAIETESFILHYQPKFDSQGTRIIGLEALIRWRMPSGELRYPGSFIETAEQTGQIIDISNFVIHEACRTVQKYRLAEQNIHIAINLSATHFQSESMVEDLEKIVRHYNIPFSAIEIEITETSLIQNFVMTSKILRDLKALGFTLALDDFGTGYSSLMYLRELPIDKIKIDKSFVDKIGNEKQEKVLVAIIRLTKELEFEVTIEGVETEEQFLFLKKVLPTEFQGYYFSKPKPFEEILRLIEHQLETDSANKVGE